MARYSKITHSGFLYQVEFVFDDLVLLLGRYTQEIAKQQQLEAVQKFKDNLDFSLFSACAQKVYKGSPDYHVSFIFSNQVQLFSTKLFVSKKAALHFAHQVVNNKYFPVTDHAIL